MRLLDLIAQGRSAIVDDPDALHLPGASSFAPLILDCPLRYVLADDLVQCSTALAYAEGDRLSTCLDLVRVPARQLWVEWIEAPRAEMLSAVPSLDILGSATQKRAGVLVRSHEGERSGTLRTFWSNGNDVAFMAPLITEFDLDCTLRAPCRLETLFEGGWAGVRLEEEQGLDELLAHIRFQFDPAWAAYYRAADLGVTQRAAVLRGSLNSLAFDVPMLMAFFLLLGARDRLPQRPADLARLNRSRYRSGKAALLDHIEVKAPIGAPAPPAWLPDSGGLRHTPRLHHVRGHLVRRGATIFWRSPHMRGAARLGRVQTRTVELSFARS